jgi:uncharacterized protein (DUF488 family)
VSADALVSLGYEGRTAAEVVSRLQHESVTVLVDVRLTPLSRKPGLSKRRLTQTLADAGIRYLHLPALGNPPENRPALRSGDPAGRQAFRSILEGQQAVEALRQVARLLDSETVALLCFERDPGSCHRQLVAETLLARRPELRLVDA